MTKKQREVKKKSDQKLKPWRREDYKIRMKDYHLKYKYNISLKEYEEMVFNQNGLCAICKNPPITHNKILKVDHNHKTGKIRGLLCDFCNFAIGNAKEDILILESAIEYLKHYES